MRTLVVFFLLMLKSTCYSQEVDLKVIDSIAKIYLHTIYVEKDIAKGALMWDTTFATETFNRNFGRGDTLNSLLLISELFDKYSISIKQLKNIYINDTLAFGKIQSEGNKKRIFITFYYSENKSPKEWINNGILIFNSYDSGKTWKIYDLRIQ